MSQIHAEKINSAINTCLDAVCDNDERTAVVENFLNELRHDPRWLDWEVQEVAEAVHHTADLIGR
jgi:hypothetical protein